MTLSLHLNYNYIFKSSNNAVTSWLHDISRCICDTQRILMLVKGERWDELSESRLNMLFSFSLYHHLGLLVKVDRYISRSGTTRQISAWLDFTIF